MSEKSKTDETPHAAAIPGVRASLFPTSSSSPEEQMFRLNWIANLKMTPSGVPFVSPDFVARQGRRVRIVDVRTPEELTGVLGHIPGSDWVPLDRIRTLPGRIDPNDPIIIVSAGEERSHDAAEDLVKAGLKFVAFMFGGIIAWRDLGYSTTRDGSILDRKDVVRDVSGPQKAPDMITSEHVREHVGDPLSVKWIKLPALLVRGLVSCVDGRDDSGVIGSPGGDAGELLVGLRALERVIRRELRESEIETLMARRLDVFGRFYMHTDVAAANGMIKSLRAEPRFGPALAKVNDALDWRQFFADPPAEFRDKLLEQSLEPAHIGCGHLRLALTQSAEYETRAPLVRTVLRFFHVKRWEGARELEFVPLAGGHTERAVINVRIGGPLLPFSRIPLVSPAALGMQFFIHHPRITSYLRMQLAQFLVVQKDIVGSDVDPAELHVEMQRLGMVQLGRTLGALAKGLPIFDVTFHANQSEERVDVQYAGVV